MKRVIAILMVLVTLAFASGALFNCHEMEESAEDARADARAAVAAAAGKPIPVEHHDESHCLICAQLHMAIVVIHWTPIIACLGILFIGVILPASRRGSLAEVLVNSCRGPPAGTCLSQLA